MTRDEVFFELMESIYEVSRITSIYEGIPRKYGTDDELYMVEAHTINLIGDKIKTNTSELTQLTDKTKGAISQMVDKLVKKGLVLKYKNPANNREVIIELTEKGQQVYEYHKALDKMEYAKILNRLDEFSTDDFEKFIKISSILSDITRESLKNK
ncbi:MarR family winged helix-turn-helix transcriptional regulator [Lysinibacillus boronitolerans]|uniref:MarR family winged helix-turn-helix transcriptional regulator n=1 Tax=Lysinibacillus boronitolerans TaxID=309788 RepID=UPI002161C864|nr:MarR family transcriptional regulator [Lysinibacillus boronitolerans]MCS1392211.1 MarR family transcriptional regulator [Lysinibacillus boronitolerans]